MSKRNRKYIRTRNRIARVIMLNPVEFTSDRGFFTHHESHTWSASKQIADKIMNLLGYTKSKSIEHE